MDNKQSWTRWLQDTKTLLILIIVIYVALVSFSNQAFFSLETFFTLTKSTSTMVMLAMGVLIVMISGGVDLSCASIALCAGYTTLKLALVLGFDSVPLMFVLGIVIGVGLGLINGLLVHLLKLSAFIITLGTSSFFHGLLTLLVGVESIGSARYPESYKALGLAKFWTSVTEVGATIGMSVSIFPALITLAVAWFLLNKTVVGKGIYALGCSPLSAQRAGFNLLKIRLIAFGTAGAIYGAMGVMALANLGLANATSLTGQELSIVAAVVLGGANVKGGEGSILGTYLGVVVIWLFNSTLIYLGISSSWNSLFIGLVLLLSLFMTFGRARKVNRRHFIFTE